MREWETVLGRLPCCSEKAIKFGRSSQFLLPRNFKRAACHWKKSKKSLSGFDLEPLADGTCLTVLEASPNFPSDLCHRCGTEGHGHDSCSKPVLCRYPLCQQAAHDIKVCRILHDTCFTCRQQGHRADHHHAYSQILLDELVLQWSPHGWYTSIVWQEARGFVLPPSLWCSNDNP